MKKLLLTIGLVAATGSLAFAQGTIGFNNNAGSRISTGVAGSAASTWVALPIGAGAVSNFVFGVFYGMGQSTSLSFLATAGVNSTSGAGVIANFSDNKTAINVLALPGTTPGEADVWLKIAGWSSAFGPSGWENAKNASLLGDGKAFYGETIVINCLPLGPTAGPGNSLWLTATGTDPQKFHGGFGLLTTVPEPSMMALAGLGIASMLIFRRRK